MNPAAPSSGTDTPTDGRSPTEQAHTPVVGRTPIGRPANPTRQRYATTVACTCGWDFGICTTLSPVLGDGRRLAMETWQRHRDAVHDSEGAS